MGIFQKITGAVGGSSSDVNLDELMTAAESTAVEETPTTKADSYVVPMTLQHESDIQAAQQQLAGKNIVLLNVSSLSRNPQKLKAAVDKLHEYVSSINGDIARLDDDKILLTPAAVKIVKKRRH